MLSCLAEVDIGLPIFQMSKVRPREVKPPVKLVAKGPGLSDYEAQVLTIVKLPLKLRLDRVEIKNEIFVSPQAVELQIGMGLAAIPIAVRRIWPVYNPPPHSAIATLAQLARTSGPLFLLPVLCFSSASVSGLDPAWHPDPGLHLCMPLCYLLLQLASPSDLFVPLVIVYPVAPPRPHTSGEQGPCSSHCALPLGSRRVPGTSLCSTNICGKMSLARPWQGPQVWALCL